MKHDVFTPVSTYRLQFNGEFTFKDLEQHIDYLHELGVTTIYASPIFEAAPGSMHGYDVTNPHAISPAIGTIEQLHSIQRQLQEKGMNWIQDIVPNHMALHPANSRLMDVLERGPNSPYYNYFDIDWAHPDTTLTGKLMLPFLGQPLPAILEAGEIKLLFSPQGWQVQYGELAFPLSAPAYEVLLNALPQEDAATQEWLQALQRGIEKPHTVKEWEEQKASLFARANETRLQQLTDQVNEDAVLLAALLDQQYYLFTFWQEAETRINYRRFFTVNGLIALRMEDPEVFDEYHTFLHEMYKQGLIQGLRIDHIDGLRNPGEYIRRLRELFGARCYIIAEKILAGNETMPREWLLQGSTGYEFLGDVSQLLTDQQGFEKIARNYRSQFPDLAKYDKLVIKKKQLILETQMEGEWDNLVRYCYTLGLADIRVNEKQLKKALGLLMIHLPVYRIYPEQWPLSTRSLSLLEYAMDGALRSDPELTKMLELIRSWWQLDKRSEQGIKFLQRMMQFTGPLTAKGVEDTTFYVYNALISHNEVGDAPEGSKCSLIRFHEHAGSRQRYHPLSLNATATHDTKRGEDGRIRLNTLTLHPNQWIQQVQQWHTMNKPFSGEAAASAMPDMNDEYFIYQSVLSGFPADGVVTPAFKERLTTYITKVLREAKVHSNWSAPNEEYEQACTRFIENLFAADHPFTDSMGAYFEKINQQAQIYSLTQTLIKITAPGIPDIYQGCELWDLSFVDPDNRRPVDYAQRKQWLAKLQQQEKAGVENLLGFLHEHRAAGMEKLYVTWKALQARRAYPSLFAKGEYLPVYNRDDHSVIAYARKEQDKWCLVIAPLIAATHAGREEEPLTLALPEGAPLKWKHIFTQEEITTPNGQLPTGMLEKFPVAFLVSE